jgi:hypothetical protein
MAEEDGEEVRRIGSYSSRVKVKSIEHTGSGSLRERYAGRHTL